MTDFTEYWKNLDKSKSLDQVYTEACRKFPNELVDYAMLIKFDYKKKQLSKEDVLVVLKKDITDRTIKMVQNLYPENVENEEDKPVEEVPVKRGRGRPRTRPIKETPGKPGRPRKGDNDTKLWDKDHRRDYFRKYYKDRKDDFLERQRTYRLNKKIHAQLDEILTKNGY